MENKFTLTAFNSIVCSFFVLIFAKVGVSQNQSSREPFEYFSRPFTAIGVLGGPEAAMVTPEGFLAVEYMTLKFYTSEKRNALTQKVKTLVDGYVPIVEMRAEDDVEYDFTLFAVNDLGLTRVEHSVKNIKSNVDNMLCFVEIKAKNRGVTPKPISLYVGVDFGTYVNRYKKDKYLFESRAAAASKISEMKAGLMFDTSENILSNSSHVFLSSSIRPAEVIGFKNDNEFVIKFTGNLKPDQEKRIIIKMPYWPAQFSDVSAMQKANFSRLKQETVNFWEKLFSEHLSIELPEKKVTDVFKASLMYILTGGLKIMENEDGKHFIMHVNSFQYDWFWVRDAAKIIYALDYAGFHKIAENCLRYLYRNYQQPDGSYASQKGQLDGVGQGLWGIGQHYQLTGDKKWAREVFPSLSRAVAWLSRHLKANDGLIQASTANDNELVENGQYLGHNLWALMGLKAALPIAKVVSAEIYQNWLNEYQNYHRRFLTALDKLTEQTGGLIPPSFQGFVGQCLKFGAYGDVFGIDWGNLMVVYPTGVLPPDDVRVEKSMKIWRSLFREGLLTYPKNMDFSSIHAYNTQWVTGTSLLRNEQQDVLGDLYTGFLLHTTATNAGCEGIDALQRDFSYDINLSPHGQFAARYVWLLREMLVREEEDTIHLLSCLSPAWLENDGVIKVTNAATHFGVMGLKVKWESAGLTIKIDPPTRKAFDHFTVHFPFWFDVKKVTVNGKIRHYFNKDSIILAPEETQITLQGEKRQSNKWNYISAVQEYQMQREKFQSALEEERTLNCPDITSAVTIDGDMTGEWDKAARVDGFVQVSESAGTPQQKTSAFVMRKQDTLYVAFRCEDRDLSSEFPTIWTHDYVAVAIEKDRSKNIFNFIAVDQNNQVEMLEVIRDGYGWRGTSLKKVPIAGIQSVAKRFDSGYVVEICLPFSKNTGGKLKFNLFRNDASPLYPFSIEAWKFTGFNFLAFEHFGWLVM